MAQETIQRKVEEKFYSMYPNYRAFEEATGISKRKLNEFVRGKRDMKLSGLLEILRALEMDLELIDWNEKA